MEDIKITIKIWAHCYLFVYPFYWVIMPECEFEGENFWNEKDMVWIHRNDLPPHSALTVQMHKEVGRYYRTWIFIQFLCFKLKFQVWRMSWAGKKYPSGYDARIHKLIKTDDE